MMTAFHKLAETKLTNFDSSSISMLYKVAKAGILKTDTNSKVMKKLPYVLPLIENTKGDTPLDIVFKEGRKNVNLAYQFLSNIRDYHFMHSGPVINRIIPAAIRDRVPMMDVFLDSRLVTSLHTKSGDMEK